MQNNYIISRYGCLTYKKMIEFILKFMENDGETAAKIINHGIDPFYLMKKEEFSEIIKYFNNCKYGFNNYKNMTYEQIERLLNEVDNPVYISKNKIIIQLIYKKYNKY